MTPERFRELKEIFLRVRLLPVDQRPGSIAVECGDDAELQALLFELLSRDDDQSALDEPALGAGFSVPAPDDLVAESPDGRRIFFLGRLRLKEVIGHGGSAVVYRAEQSEPRRDVAVKVLYGIDPTDDDVARLRREAEALGRLHHPGVAQVYDCGVTDTLFGRQPFVAMELVDGAPITRFADERGLSATERIDLLARVADAVQHAHEQRVVHLDLKPANVLVNAKGDPKIVDFGHARIASSAAEGALRSGGTPPYMSPEQRGQRVDEVGPAADIHALGVLGLELLDGAARGAANAKRVLRRASSAEIRDRQSSAASLAADLRRGARPRVTRASIVIGAAAAAMIVAAILLWSQGTRTSAPPVEVDPHAKVIELLRSSANERWTGMTTAALADIGDPEVEVAMREVLAAFHYQAGDVGQSEREAREALEHATARLGPEHPSTLRLTSQLGVICLEQGRLDEAARLLDQASAASDAVPDPLATRAHSKVTLGYLWLQWGRLDEARDLLNDVFHGATLDGSPAPTPHQLLAAGAIGEIEMLLGNRLCPLPLLQQAAESARRFYGDEHAVTLTITDRFAEHLAEHGEPAAALDILDSNIARKEKLYGADHSVTLSTRQKRARAVFVAGRIDEGIAELRAVFDHREEDAGPLHPDTILTGHLLAELLAHAQRHGEAIALYDSSLANAREALPDSHWLIAMICRAYGQALVRFGRHAEGEEMLAEAIDRFRALGNEEGSRLGGVDVLRLRAETHLAESWYESGRLEESERLSAEVRRQYEVGLGEHHARTLQAVENHAVVLSRIGRLTEAETELLRVAAAYDEMFDTPNDNRFMAHLNLASVVQRQGRWDDAIEIFQSIEPWCDEDVILHHRRPNLLMSIGICATRAGRTEEGLQYARAALDEHRRIFGETHHDDAEYQGNLAFALIESGRPDEAEPLLRACRAKLVEQVGASHPLTLRVMNNLATALDHQEKPEAADAWREVFEARRAALGDDHPDALITHNNYAGYLMRHGEETRAVKLFDELCDVAVTSVGEESYEVALYRRNYARCLIQLDRHDEARALLIASLETLMRHCGDDHPTTRSVRALLEKLDGASGQG